MKEYHSTRFLYDKKRDKVWKVISKYIQKYIPNNSSVLDLGAAYCNFINNINAQNKYAVDIFPDMKKFANKDVKCFITSAENLNFLKDNSINTVFASNLFEHFDDKTFQKVINEIRRVLKKDGYLIIIQPNFKYCYKEYFDDYTHIKIYTDKGLSDILIKNEFSIIKNIPNFIPFSMKSKLPVLSPLIWLYLHSFIRPFAGQMLLIVKK